MTRISPGKIAGRLLARVAALVVISAAPCAAADALTRCADVVAVDLRRICERGELRVARYGGERPPFFHRDGEGWVGFDVDLARDIAARLGVHYVHDVSAQSFDEVIDRVASGSVDIGVSKLSATLDRAQRIRFSDPYLTVYQALLVNRVSTPRGSDPFNRLDVEDALIGALAGSSYVGYAATSFRSAEIRPYESFDTMMGDVLTGYIDAALLDSAHANAWRRENRSQLIRVRTTVDKRRKDRLAIAVGPGDPQLLAWINLYLQRIEDDGTAEALYERWFTDPEPRR